MAEAIDTEKEEEKETDIRDQVDFSMPLSDEDLGLGQISDQPVPEGVIPEREERPTVRMEGISAGPGEQAFQAALSVRGIEQERLNPTRVVNDFLSSHLGEEFAVGERFGDPRLHMDFARSRTPEQKADKFAAKYPEGDLVALEIPLGEGRIRNVMIGRRTQREPYKIMQNLPAEAIGAIGSIGGTASIAAGLAFPPGTVASALVIGGVYMLGALADREVERLRGFEDRPRSETTTEALGEGAFTGLVDYGVGKVLGPLVRGGYGATRYSEEAMLSSEAGVRQGLPDLMRGQTSKYPIFRALFRQTQKTMPGVEQRTLHQERELLRRLRQEGDVESVIAREGQDMDVLLENIVRTQSDELDELMPRVVSPRTEGGMSIQRGLEEFNDAAQLWVARKYDRAFQAAGDDVAFDITNVQQLGTRMKAGTPSRTADESVQIDLGTDIAEARRAGPVQRNAGPDEIDVRGGLHPEVKRVIDDLEKLDPTVGNFQSASRGGEKVTGYEQIKSIRTRLGDLTRSEDPAIRRQASPLYDELTRSMDNPVGGGEEFVRLHKAASNAHLFRATINEKAFIHQAARTDNPAQLAAKFTGPQSYHQLSTLKRILPKERFEDVRRTFVSDLMSAPERIHSRLNSYRTDPRMLSILLDEGLEESLRAFGNAAIKMNRSPIAKQLELDMEAGQAVMNIIRRGTSGQLEEAVELSGGPNSPWAQSARAGVYRMIADRATTRLPDGSEAIDMRNFERMIRGLRNSGKLNAVFRPKDLEVIDGLSRWAAAQRAAGGTGAGIQVGELAAGASNPVRAARFMGTLMTLLGHAGWGAALSRPATRGLLKSPALDITSAESIRKAAQAYSITANAYENRSKKDDFYDPLLPRGLPAAFLPTSAVTGEGERSAYMPETPRQIQDTADYNALDAGAYYLDPQGILRQKQEEVMVDEEVVEVGP